MSETEVILGLVRARLDAASKDETLDIKGLEKLRRFLAQSGKLLLECSGPLAKADAQLMSSGNGLGGWSLGDSSVDAEQITMMPNPVSPNPETFAATLLRELTAGAGNLTMMYKAATAAKLAEAAMSARKAGNSAMADKLSDLFETVTSAPKAQEDTDAEAGGDQGEDADPLPAVPPA